MKITIPLRKPRAKQLNEILMTRRGGKMRDIKDNNRQQAKRDLQKQIHHEKH